MRTARPFRLEGSWAYPPPMDSFVPSVLVVDDDVDIRQGLVELLGDGDWQLATATDGFDALEKLQSLKRPRLVLLDLMMPRMSGLEFLDCLSSRPDLRDVTVVVMSASDALRREARRHVSVRGTLKKPFELEELLALIETGGAEAARTSEWPAGPQNAGGRLLRQAH